MGIPSIHVYIQLAPQGISQQRLTQYTIPSVLNLESPFSYYLSSDYHVKYTLVADIGATEMIPTVQHIIPWHSVPHNNNTTAQRTAQHPSKVSFLIIVHFIAGDSVALLFGMLLNGGFSNLAGSVFKFFGGL